MFEDTRALLRKLRILPTGLNEQLRKFYGLLEIFQNGLLALSAAMFALWLARTTAAHLFASLVLLVAGIMPALTRAQLEGYPVGVQVVGPVKPQ